jgi:hypothetical protein
MPRGSRVRESVGRIEDEILDQYRRDSREQARDDAELRRTAIAARDDARDGSPVDTGNYAAAWQIEKGPHVDPGTGLRSWRVINRDFKARWIEYGTGEPYPTEEFAVARKTAAKFGGSVDG